MVFQSVYKKALPGSRLPAETYEGRVTFYNEGVMKIIKPSVEFFGAVPTEYNAALEFIEMAGRTCYKSEDKITEDSAEGFVRKLISARPTPHLAMVEHSNFAVRCYARNSLYLDVLYLATGKYLNILSNVDGLYVGGNLTAWAQAFENWGYDYLFWPFIDQYGELFGFNFNCKTQSAWKACPHHEIPKELRRYSAKFICDRGVSHELVRHRPCSFAQESTRYVNYGDKDMEFIEPDGFDDWGTTARHWFSQHCADSEQVYRALVSSDFSPQQARAVLPNALKTEIVVTADAAEWAHIRKLRTAKSAHPDMQRVMNTMPWEEFLEF